MSVRVWRTDREAVLARLRQWATELGRDPQVLAVVLFGSLARGDHTAASDADVLILLRESEEDFRHRIPRFLPVGLGVGADVFPYTLEEARRSLTEGWGVVRAALAEGQVLFERADDSPLPSLRRLLTRSPR